jgi:hypothetical protein
MPVATAGPGTSTTLILSTDQSKDNSLIKRLGTYAVPPPLLRSGLTSLRREDPLIIRRWTRRPGRAKGPEEKRVADAA